MPDKLETQLKAAVDAVVASRAMKKIVVAGPGTGKTWLFERLIEADAGEPEEYLILTFINNLKNDLERELGNRAQVYTFHGYCRRLLHRVSRLRTGLTEDFKYFPPLASLIKGDWELIRGGAAPQFVGLMRELNSGQETDFYLERANFYDAVAFDDSVFRVYKRFEEFPQDIAKYRLLLVDEYQDFNRLEAAFIGRLATVSPTVIAGDDDQALYSQLRGSSPAFIRQLYVTEEYQAFPLPFCMRCTEPIVLALGDIVRHSQRCGKLQGRIQKPYLFYPPKKAADSKLYPKIKLVRTTIQNNATNYFGQYIEQEIRRIPPEDIQDSAEGHFPTVLVIGPSQYLRQVKYYLENAGFACQAGDSDNPVELRREDGLNILKQHADQNLDWRIVLEDDHPLFIDEAIRRSAAQRCPLVEVIPYEYRVQVLLEADQLSEESESDDGRQESDGGLTIRFTSFEGSKGLSAHHVFILGLQSGDLPRDSSNVTDLEICKFLVALTRTRKRCHILHTGRWSGQLKHPSIFLQWISPQLFEMVEVNRSYWE